MNMLVRIRAVTMAIVPVTCGKMDVWDVCVLIREMPPGVMERKVLTMTTTTRTIKRTHLVIAIRITGNVLPSFYQGRLLANMIGSVPVDWNAALGLAAICAIIFLMLLRLDMITEDVLYFVCVSCQCKYIEDKWLLLLLSLPPISCLSYRLKYP